MQKTIFFVAGSTTNKVEKDMIFAWKFMLEELGFTVKIREMKEAKEERVNNTNKKIIFSLQNIHLNMREENANLMS